MNAQVKTPDIAAAGVARIGKETGAPGLQQDARQQVNPATLTCTWVRADDGDLVMRWTVQTPDNAHVQTPGDENEETTRAAA